jgi:hypothetical protein
VWHVQDRTAITPYARLPHSQSVTCACDLLVQGNPAPVAPATLSKWHAPACPSDCVLSPRQRCVRPRKPLCSSSVHDAVAVSDL